MRATEIKPNGFCGGVVRALKMIAEACKNPETPRPITLLGLPVHNKKISRAIIDEYHVNIITENFRENLKKIKKGTVIFSAHGTSPELKATAVSNNLNIIDTVCPYVLKTRKKIEEKLNDGYKVVIIGNGNHPETVAYLGISDQAILYTPETDLRGKTFLVNQTTLVYDEIVALYREIQKKYPESERMEQVCTATKERQRALREKSVTFDALIVVGDKLSNNCESLYRVAEETGLPAFKIETADDLNAIDLSRYRRIGVTAGASSHPAVIEEVIKELNENPEVYRSVLQNRDYLKI